MLGDLARNKAVGVAAAALIIVGGLLLVCRRSARPTPGAAGQALYVCLEDGTRFLAEARAVGGEGPPCPTCGAGSFLARVFRCPKGHVYVGYLAKPPDPDAPAEDEYARHAPRLLRPGLDKGWIAAAPDRGPVCPVCGLGVERAVGDLSGVDPNDVHMGKLASMKGASK